MKSHSCKKTPIRVSNWPTYVDGFGAFSDETRTLVNEVLDSGRLFRYDTREYDNTMVGKYENAIKEFFGCKYALAVSSGTAALALALMALDLPSGFEVACPMFGFAANPSSILLAGGKPKLFACDENLNFDFDDLENRWSENIKAIMVVHMRGMAQPIEKIVKFAKEKGVYVIEDAVPALGVCINGKPLGMFSDIGCFSSQSDKTVNTGEGGFIVTNNIKMFERAVILSGAYENRVKKHPVELTIDGRDEYKLPIYSFRMDELRAAVALPQISLIKYKVEKYKENYLYLERSLSSIVRVRKSYYDDGNLGDSFIFFIDGVEGSKIASALSEEGIPARCLGSNDNVRSFEQWEFVDEVKNEEFNKLPSIMRTSAFLRAAVDIPLSYLLEKKDLDDLIIAVNKVVCDLQ